MKIYLLFAIYIFVLLGCNTSDFNDRTKRNENWAWWEDAKTGRTKWLQLGNKSSNIKHAGKYTLFYSNGNVREVGKNNSGVLFDTTFFYDINGELRSYQIQPQESYYFIRDGAIKIHHPNGKIWSEGIIENHSFGDKWIKYYQNGNIEFVNNFVQDTGWIVNYYESGQIQDSIYHSKGSHDLSIKSWYENGQLKQSNEFNNKGFNGTCLNYYENGQLKDSGLLVNGKREKIGYEWFENGVIKAINNYNHGKLNGRQYTYHKNGKTKTIGNLMNGILSGEVKQYDEKGKLISVDYYEDNIKIKN
jgi:antitoxin component YwqK of YwqJK toxin-antitoxin module